MLITSVYLPPSGVRPHSPVKFPGNTAAVAALPSGNEVINRKQARNRMRARGSVRVPRVPVGEECGNCIGPHGGRLPERGFYSRTGSGHRPAHLG